MNPKKENPADTASREWLEKQKLLSKEGTFCRLDRALTLLLALIALSFGILLFLFQPT